MGKRRCSWNKNLASRIGGNMASIRKKLAQNVNDSKNTRMEIAGAGVMDNWRPD